MHPNKFFKSVLPILPPGVSSVTGLPHPSGLRWIQTGSMRGKILALYTSIYLPDRPSEIEGVLRNLLKLSAFKLFAPVDIDAVVSMVENEAEQGAPVTGGEAEWRAAKETLPLAEQTGHGSYLASEEPWQMTAYARGRRSVYCHFETADRQITEFQKLRSGGQTRDFQVCRWFVSMLLLSENGPLYAINTKRVPDLSPTYSMLISLRKKSLV